MALNNTLLKIPPIRRLLITALLSALMLFGLYFLVFRGHLFNHNMSEIARRIQCRANLLRIADVLKDKHLRLEQKNIPEIEAILDELDLHCPSGKKLYPDETASLYQIVLTQDGNVVITENADNHDSQKMKFTDCPYVRYCLYQQHVKDNDFALGAWKDKHTLFKAIERVR